MNTVIILIVSMAACLFADVAKKLYTDRSVGSMTSLHSYNAWGCIVSAIVLLLWGGIESLSLLTVLLGILFGLLISLQSLTVMKALQIGPMSYTMVIVNCSTVISAVSGVLFFHESIGLWQIVGIVLMLFSFAFAVEKKADEKKASLKWLIFSILAFFMTGGIGIMQKVHQNLPCRAEINAFLVFAFIASFLISAALMLVYRAREGQPIFERTAQGRVNWFLVSVMLVSGVLVAANHKLNLYLSGIMDSAVFFPIVNGGGLVLITLTAVVAFREKLTLKQWIGVGFGVLSVLFLCLPT
ncbi:MAG: EamA family transporter [Clostridia bacterium]|nr:EamA family transporter [Clostridia bacterium]